jgi:hypothetical protein
MRVEQVLALGSSLNACVKMCIQKRGDCSEQITTQTFRFRQAVGIFSPISQKITSFDYHPYLQNHGRLTYAVIDVLHR